MQVNCKRKGIFQNSSDGTEVISLSPNYFSLSAAGGLKASKSSIRKIYQSKTGGCMHKKIRTEKVVSTDVAYLYESTCCWFCVTPVVLLSSKERLTLRLRCDPPSGTAY